MNSFDRNDVDVFTKGIFHSILTIHYTLFTITSLLSYQYSNKQNYEELKTKLFILEIYQVDYIYCIYIYIQHILLWKNLFNK